VVKHVLFSTLIAALVFLAPQTSWSAKPARNLLPIETKGYVSIPDVDMLRKKFNETQIGKLANDPLMAPFAEDLKEQIQEKMSDTAGRLKITLADIEGVYGGEVCIAMIQPNGDPHAHGLALLVDVTGNVEKAEQLLKKVSANLMQEGAKRSVQQLNGVTLVSFDIPAKRGQLLGRNAHYFLVQDQLVAVDHKPTAASILNRFTAADGKSLADDGAFAFSMNHCDKGATTEPHIRWFVEPFGYTQVARASSGGRRKRGQDLLKVLENQGFAAVQGFSGHVTFSTADNDMMHHTYIYAPPIAGNPERYNLAARLLNFPNTLQLAPANWVPTDAATYMSFNWKMKEAFEYSKTLVNELVGSEVFEEMLEGIKLDPNGPQIDIREDLIKNFADRATMISDHKLPIDPKCERLLFAIDITNPDKVAKAINKAMEKDQGAKKTLHGTQIIWEIIKDNKNDAVGELEIETPGFDDFDDFEDFGPPAAKEAGPDKAGLPNSAITVLDRGNNKGLLVIASHVDHIVHVLDEMKKPEELTRAVDYNTVSAALTKLGAGPKSFLFFARTAQAYRPTYELLRQGKMPQSETAVGKFLNRALGTGEDGVLREQKIDASKLPAFAKVEHYFAPAGLFVETTDKGWIVKGCLINRESNDKAVLNSAALPVAIPR
jgi:hypothetical protein